MTATTQLTAGAAEPSRNGAAPPPEAIRKKRKRFWSGLFALLKSDTLQRGAVAAWMNFLIVGTAAITAVTAGFFNTGSWPVAETWGPGALKLFVLWCLAFLPGWLYIRFLRMRAKALWNEYVLTLHRLGWDRPEFLPEPPKDSEFHERWRGRPNGVGKRGDNIYRQKFEAYYGRQVTKDADNAAGAATQREKREEKTDFVVRSESLFPIFLATSVFAAGWAAVLWDTSFLTSPTGIWDVLKYGFLGAYAFAVSMLIRRFFQSDLRPSAYASAVLRIVVVLLLVAVLHQVLPASPSALAQGELAVAFLIGFFPLIGISILQQVVSKTFGGVVPSLQSEYPLDQLDGFSIWYEARLMEEGIEDLQNLTTMNLVDVVLHTRVPPGRLIDWIDQAFLLIHLEPATRDDLKLARQGARSADGTGKPEPSHGAKARVALRRFGIRTATDLLRAFPAQPTTGTGCQQSTICVPDVLISESLGAEQLRLLVAVLRSEPALAPVWNWQRNGVLEYPPIGAISPSD
jgi:nitrate reductase NapE component